MIESGVTRACMLLCFIGSTGANSQHECKNTEPFGKIAKYEVRVDVYDLSNESPICTRLVNVKEYDVRGREEDDYWCLKPLRDEIVTCNHLGRSIRVIPGVRYRKAGLGKDMHAFHFHSYIGDEQRPDDLFARVLSQESPTQMTVQAAYKDADQRGRHSYFVNCTFKIDKIL